MVPLYAADMMCSKTNINDYESQSTEQHSFTEQQ